MNTQPANTPLPVANPQGTDDEMLGKLQKETFAYFVDQMDPATGLISDKTSRDSHCSIAVVGLGLCCFTVGVERGYISRDEAAERTLKILRFLYHSKQGTEPDATGYKGFYYHFVEMHTGRRAWECELSTIDTAILMSGALTASCYFTADDKKEKEIRELAEALYRRVDWQWALNGETTFTHGWKPDTGFMDYRWNNGYSEAHILYLLALGSPTHPVDKKGYDDWVATFEWKNIYDTDFLYAGPLFIHQLSQLWINFRNIRDSINRKYNIDYFENSRRAVYIQQQYAIKNPLAYERYGRYCWGLSASDGPGPATYKVKGIERVFYDYIARGVPYGPDDGTISPWGIVASLPFAPEIVLDTIRHAIERLNLIKMSKHDLKTDNHGQGFHAAFNATFPITAKNHNGWISPCQYGLNQGPVVLMIENYRTGLPWRIFGKCPYIVEGLKKAGFEPKADSNQST